MKIFCNSQGTQSRDPSVIKHNGKYYWTYAYENKLYIMEADTVDGFAHGEGKLVWTPERPEYAKEVWAPELHVIDGVCYIYVACDDGMNCNHRMYVLSNGSSDPLDAYSNIGKIADSTDKWAIDGTVLRHKNKLYFVWSGWEGDKDGKQNLYIAHMSDPCTIDSERVMISTPEYDWETVEWPDVNEGPTVLQHGERTFVVYSASGSWGDYYCLGMLTLVGEDPLDPASWKKESHPVFTRRSGVCYGPGHCSFSTAVDGSVWMIYHGNQVSDTGWEGRSVWISPVIFEDDGTPYFGRPEPEVWFPIAVES